MDQIEKLKQWVSESSRIVFFGGAGFLFFLTGFFDL